MKKGLLPFALHKVGFLRRGEQIFCSFLASRGVKPIIIEVNGREKREDFSLQLDCPLSSVMYINLGTVSPFVERPS